MTPTTMGFLWDSHLKIIHNAKSERSNNYSAYTSTTIILRVPYQDIILKQTHVHFRGIMSSDLGRANNVTSEITENW